MDGPRTLAIDIGGTGVKAALLDASGNMIGERSRVPTPPKPVSPEDLTHAIDSATAPLGDFDRVSVGFPGAVREGRVLTAPNLGTELWAGFDLQSALSERWGKPVRVMNDADVQGFGAIQGEGLEMVLTLGTGAGTALFYNGQIMPHLELSHHPVRNGMTYDEYIGRVARVAKGKKAWNKRVARVIDILRTVVNFDHLYLGGGNAKDVKLDLPHDITIVSNTDGLTGGIALWSAETAAQEGGAAARSRAMKSAHLGAPAPAEAGSDVGAAAVESASAAAATEAPPAPPAAPPPA